MTGAATVAITLASDTRIDELWSLYWTAGWETIYIVAIAMLLGGALGLILGLALYVSRRGGIFANRPVFVVLNVLVNFFRPIPFVIFIALVQPLSRAIVGIGIGNKAVIVALTIGAMFGISRIVEQNLVTVQPGVIEAARSVGAGRFRIVWSILVPEALGPLILGYTFAFIAVVDMATIAGVIGGGGIGNFALQYGYRQFDNVVTWTSVLFIVVFVQLIQLVGNVLARRVLRR